MPKSRPPHPPELRQRTIELVRAERTPKELANEFEASAHTWDSAADNCISQSADGTCRTVECAPIGHRSLPLAAGAITAA